MLDSIKKPTKKMAAYYTIAFLVTLALYPLLLYPFKDLTLLGHADFFRVGIGIPVAFTFLFGPAAALGAAFGNVIYDAATSGVTLISVFGFVANFLVAYLPYKLWQIITSQKPDLRSAKKLALFSGLTFLASIICGLIIGAGLYWLYQIPLVPTALVIGLTDAFWGIIVGSVVLALSYGYFSRRKLLCTDFSDTNQASNKG